MKGTERISREREKNNRARYGERRDQIRRVNSRFVREKDDDIRAFADWSEESLSPEWTSNREYSKSW